MVIKFQKSAIKATSFHLNFSIASLLWLCIAAATVLSVHRQISSLCESMETKKQKNENLWKNGEQTQLYSPYKRENVAVPRPTMFAEISIFSSSSTLWKFSFKHKKNVSGEKAYVCESRRLPVNRRPILFPSNPIASTFSYV